MSWVRQLLGLGHNAMFKNRHIGIWSLVLLTCSAHKVFLPEKVPHCPCIAPLLLALLLFPPTINSPYIPCSFLVCNFVTTLPTYPIQTAPADSQVQYMSIHLPLQAVLWHWRSPTCSITSSLLLQFSCQSLWPAVLSSHLTPSAIHPALHLIHSLQYLNWYWSAMSQFRCKGNT